MIHIRQHQYELTIDTLTDIMASIIEHQEQLDLTKMVNLIDHYRIYLRNHANVELTNVRPIEFETFINDQTLLNAAAELISAEAGEPVLAPCVLYKLS